MGACWSRPVAGPLPPAREADGEPSDASEGFSTASESSPVPDQRRAFREMRSALAAPAATSPGRGAAMPGKERTKKEEKKLLKGLQIFKRSKSKQSLHSSPSITAAVDVDSPSTPEERRPPVFTSSSPPTAAALNSAASLDPLPCCESPPAQARRSSVTPISLSRIVGEVAEPEPSRTSCDAASIGASSATPSSDTELNGFHGGINGELAEKLRKVEELERKIKKMKEDVDRATERKRRQEELDSKIIEALILEKMHGMGLLKSQMTDVGIEPEITHPETPPPTNGLSASDAKMGPLAKFAQLTSAADAVSSNPQISSTNASNTSTRVAKRSNVLAHSSSSSSSELTARLGGQLAQSLTTSQTEQQNFNRKVSQSSITNGVSGDASRLAAAGKVGVTPVTSALEAQAQAVKALQSKASATSMAITSADARQLADSFDSLKKLSMDQLPDSLSIEKLDDRDLLNIDLSGASGDKAPRDPNVKVFEHNQTFSSSNKKLVTNDFSTEEATANREEMTRLQQGDSAYRENKASSDMRAKLEMNGVKAEKGLSTRQEERHITTGDVTHDESRSAAVAGAKISTDSFSAEEVSMADDQQSQTVTSVGVVNKEQHSHAATRSKITISKQQGVTTPTSPAVAQAVDELEKLDRNTDPLEATRVLNRCSQQVQQLLRGVKAFASQKPQQKASVIDQMDAVMTRAWTVPAYGQELGNSLCDVIRDSGGLDMLISSVNTGSKEMDLKSARVLGQCLTTSNRQYVVERGLDDVVQTACRTCSEKSDEEEARVGSGLLEHLFKHSEDTCSDVVRMGGLDAVLAQCKNKDVETLRHCASALANLALYGGPENQQAMMQREVPTWLFPLAFHNDDNIKYYACLAITSMVANKQIEAAVLKSGTLDLVEPFVTSHDPDELSKSTVALVKGQSKNWLRRLVPVLFSKREEARKLAAFHFCMEAGVKVRQGCPEIFDEIGAIEPLKQVASSPNAVASKYAAQALRVLGHEVPYKLTQQVPLWSVQDVKEWVKQIDFSTFAEAFEVSRVDGDLLLRMSENMLKDDIGITNGILRTRFMRELNNLKKMADYASCDFTGLNDFLRDISPELSVYTYLMLSSGVDKHYLRYLTDEQLLHECSIFNSIHRLQIQQAINNELAPREPEEDMSKTLDCFISYRRSNGSQLASLLKVHLTLRGFSVFIDVERLEAGKFDNNLLNSIRQAQNFILVLTPSALDRCIQDYDQKDWVHKEVCAALQSKCNIIPIIDNFQWPEAEELPEDMRAICTFNGISWIHDYQDACVDKLERFIRGEVDRPDGRYVSHGAGPGTPSIRPLAHAFQRTQSSDSTRDA